MKLAVLAAPSSVSRSAGKTGQPRTCTARAPQHTRRRGLQRLAGPARAGHYDSAAKRTGLVTSRDGTVLVRLGRHDVPVPEPLGVILTELIRTGRSHAGTSSPASTPWLFPGRLGQRLRHLRHEGRRAALTDLAA